MQRKITAVVALAATCFLAGYALGTGADRESVARAAPGDHPGYVLGTGGNAGLPPGHPPVHRSLPEGHPPVHGRLPEGHPPVGGACPYSGERALPGLDRRPVPRGAPEPVTT